MHRIFLTGILVFIIQLTQAQQLIKGKVFDADSTVLVGVNVSVKGSLKGTITDINGVFELQAYVTDTLVFSYIGYKTSEYSLMGRTSIFAVLRADVYTMDDVVVTALGIKKESKALGYSATQVSGDEISNNKSTSFLNAIQGKVAGVDISSASGAPGASTRIIVRGVTSLSGSNQPMFVVDGVPVSNGFSGSSSINGGTDFGNKASDINPNDIESVSILKGAAATVKYGSRAANGVVEITTKKGGEAGKMQPFITYSGTYTFEEPLRLVDYQNTFGQGIYGNAVSQENTSWGPRFDGVIRPWGYAVNGQIRMKAYRSLPENVHEFFDRGQSVNHSLSLSGGNKQSSYYLSYSKVQADGIFPTNADAYQRHTFSVRSSNYFNDKLSNTFSINYVNKKNSFVPTGQGEQSVYNQVMQTPRDISLLELRDISSPWNNVDNYYSWYTINPYFVLENNGNKHTEDRLYGNLQFNYAFNKAINIMARFGGDLSNEQIHSWKAIALPDGNNELSAIRETGADAKSTSRQHQISSDVILTYDKQWEKIGFNALAGANVFETKATGFSAQVAALLADSVYTLNNGAESPTASDFYSMKRMTGVYGSIDLDFNKLVYLSLSVRNDWSSTLPLNNNSYFYPGVNASFVFTELYDAGSFLPFGKIRMGWSQVGKDAPVYSINRVFGRAGVSDGFSTLIINGFSAGNGLGNMQLKPERTTEFEAGTDLRFFNNRLSIDMAYYINTVNNQIWAVPQAHSTGYSFQVSNLGNIENRGFEALVNISPLKNATTRWDLAFNYAKNTNKILGLSDNLDRVVLNQLTIDGGQQIYFVAKPGKPIGIFEGRTTLTTSKGQIVVDNNGLPRAADELVEYGNSGYDFTGGIKNTVSYKNISISMGIDIRYGGLMYSRTKDISTWAGTEKNTLFNNRQPFIIPNSVVEIDRVNGQPVYIENTKPIGDQYLQEYWANGGVEFDGYSLIEKSFIKVRDVTVSFDVPSDMIDKIRVKALSIGFTGRNLWLFTPAGQQYIDPEVTTFGNDIGAGFGEYGAQPTTRSFSFSMKVNI